MRKTIAAAFCSIWALQGVALSEATAQSDPSIFGCATVVEYKEFAQRGLATRALEKPAPRYPKSMIDEGRSGAVKLRILIDTNGAVVDAKALSSTHPNFEPAAIAAVRKWRYSPPTLEGKPVCVQFEFEMGFELK
jgi:TonB family protein